MGSSLCGSSPIYSYTDVQLKEMQSARPIFDLLGLKWNSKQALAIYEVFDHAVDNTESQANVNKLCKTLRLPREHFYTHSFTVFGNQSKSIVVASNRWQMAAKATVERCSFSQYLAGLWNLCTLSLPYGLAIWMYRMHFGNEGAHPKNVLELLDKRYGISEERDYHAQIDKRWYGNDYHKNNLKRTKNLIQRYTNQQTNLIPPAGWIELIKKSPGLLQNHVSSHRFVPLYLYFLHFRFQVLY
jgi:nitrate reductase NapE component